MSGIFGLLGGGSAANKQKSHSLAPRFQTSVEGRPRAIGAGQNRLSGNIIWAGDYRSTPSSAGGKGGAFTGKGTTEQYTYTESFVVSIGETIDDVTAVFNASKFDFLTAPSAAIKAALKARGIKVVTGNVYGATFLSGAYDQAPWSYLVSAHPDQALNYRGEALACFPNLALGQTPALPNFSFEVRWAINTDIEAFGPDANPADWVAAFLSNPDWGAGFPGVLLQDGDVYAANDVYALADVYQGFTEYQRWARAAGLLISPVVDGQVPANSHLADIMQGTIADFVWSAGKLKVVPYADAEITGNGFTFEPDVTPVYDLIESDFLPVTHGPGTGAQQTPVKVGRRDISLMPNKLSVEYLDRANLYNPVSISDQDDAYIIAANRTITATVRQHHYFAVADAASQSAQLQMRREKIVQDFFFTLPPQFILLDPMDIVTLTVSGLRLDRQPVRITEITKNGDGSLAFTAEEFFGTAAPALYQRQAPLGMGRNANEAPGDANTPVIFEPTDALAGGLEVWMAVSGADLTIWGGCNVWVATDSGGTYQQVGQINGSARMGVLTAILPTIAAAAGGAQTIDNTNTLSVDLSMSGGDLTSGSVSDMTALNTRALVGSEIVAFETATLTGTNAYDLAPLVRGAYDTEIAAHAIGESFVRLDDQIFKLPFTADRVGSALYIKLQSFNIYGGGVQDLADVGAIVYTIQGTALASPLPDVTSIRATFVDDTASITWDEITDFRTVRYEVRRGSSWEAGLFLGTVAHPPFAAFGDGTYWVKPVAQPVQGLTVYSETAASIALAGTIISYNEFASYDDDAGGWVGTITGDATVSAGNLISTATSSLAYYESAEVLDAYYDRSVRLDITSSEQGVPTSADFLGDPDFLGNPDIFGSDATQKTDSWIEIFVASDIAGDIYEAADVYELPDIYGGTTGAWAKYAPGVYVGRWFKRRVALITYDDTVIATVTAFASQIDVKNRIDHTNNYALSAAGETISFTPDGYGRAVPFKFGPNATALPMVIVNMLDAGTGDYYTVTALSLSSCFIRCFNSAGVGVSRTVNIYAEGA